MAKTPLPSAPEGRILDLLTDLVIVVDSAGYILDANDSARHALGIEPGAPPHFITDLVPHTDGQRIRAALKTGENHQLLETQFRRDGGEPIEVAIEIKPLRHGHDEVRVLFSRDITAEKKRDLDYLRFSNVIEHTINPIQITDAAGRMVYVNPAFEQVTGFSRDELLGQNPRMLSSGKHGQEFWKEAWQSIAAGNVWVGRVENRRKDGSPFYTELVISPIVDRSGQVVGFLGAHRDITEQKMLEQQLVRSQKLESIGTLAAGIAHEVGNPLTAISSLVQVIQRTSADEFAKEKLELIHSQVNRITRIIRELVDYSRPSTHVSKVTDINRVVQEALNIVQYGKKVKDITFAIDLASDLPQVSVVPDQVVQVFINILMNAVDALEGKAGRIAVASSYTDTQIHVVVRDTGRGISAAELEKIFEPFYTTKATGQGTGVGLWVSYGIVKSFGGDIFVESAPGEGSVFTVMFPRKGR